MDSDELEEPTSASSAAFQRAADHLASSFAAGSSAFGGVKLQAYGLFKLCTAGPCTGGRPGFWDVQGRAKWWVARLHGRVRAHCRVEGQLQGARQCLKEHTAAAHVSSLTRDAWSKAGALPREEAMQRYVELVASIEPGWAGGGGGEQQQEQRKGRKGALGGPVFSTMAACVGEEEDAGGPRQGGGQVSRRVQVHALARASIRGDGWCAVCTALRRPNTLQRLL